jgi:dolichol-phosphate mannosyltransferase
MKLSIIIPCFNEPETVGEVIVRVLAVTLPYGWQREIIVVDDGSGDATKRILNESARAHPDIKIVTRAANGGKGAALKDGFKVATGDYLMIQDADLEYDPSDIPALLEPISTHKTDVVFGSRQIAHNNVPGRFYYYWGGRAVNFLFNTAFNTHLTDLTTCYKVFPQRLVPELIKQPSNDFVFDGIELSRILAQEQVTEISIRYHARDAAHGKKLKASDGIRCLVRIVTLGFAPYARIIRFVIVGATAALLNVLVLYALTNWFGIWYIASEIVAFIIALCYNFTLQKFWTFENRHGKATRQGFSFIVLNVFNLFLNTAILYCMVEFFGLWYILAQLITSLVIACESYFLYRVIFR